MTIEKSFFQIPMELTAAHATDKYRAWLRTRPDIKAGYAESARIQAAPKWVAIAMAEIEYSLTWKGLVGRLNRSKYDRAYADYQNSKQDKWPHPFPSEGDFIDWHMRQNALAGKEAFGPILISDGSRGRDSNLILRALARIGRDRQIIVSEDAFKSVNGAAALDSFFTSSVVDLVEGVAKADFRQYGHYKDVLVEHKSYVTKCDIIIFPVYEIVGGPDRKYRGMIDGVVGEFADGDYEKRDSIVPIAIFSALFVILGTLFLLFISKFRHG